MRAELERGCHAMIVLARVGVDVVIVRHFVGSQGKLAICRGYFYNFLGTTDQTPGKGEKPLLLNKSFELCDKFFTPTTNEKITDHSITDHDIKTSRARESNHA